MDVAKAGAIGGVTCEEATDVAVERRVEEVRTGDLAKGCSVAGALSVASPHAIHAAARDLGAEWAGLVRSCRSWRVPC